MTDASLKLYYLDKIISAKTEEEKEEFRKELLAKCYPTEVEVDKGVVNK